MKFLESAVIPSLLASLLASCLSALAQQSPPPIAFDVVSVKPSAPECSLVMIGPSEDGFHLHCINLRQLIQYAYGLNLFEEDNVLGLPKWATSEHFDLDAPIQASDRVRFQGLLPPENARLLRPALEDRFKLRSHQEERTLPVYALVQGNPPLKLKPIDPSLANKPTLMRKGRNHLLGWHCTAAELASFLTPLRGRPVVDHTGLTAQFDFTLDFTPDSTPKGASPPSPEDEQLPSIFTAVQEQLGLRLIPDKGPMPVLVVESVQHPDAN